MAMSLTGQTCIVMGGTSGIGLGAAKALAAAGARVWITGRDGKKLAEAGAALGDGVEARAVDATAAAQVRAFFQDVGAFDHLVLALSGAGGGGPFRALDEAKLRAGFDGKFFAHFAAAHGALGTLREGGSITFVTAGSARAAFPGTAGLAAINGALEAMVRPLAMELAPIRINAVSPGVIETPYWAQLPEAQRQGMFAAAAAAAPARRVGRIEDVADAILFVVRNTFMTGTVIECDGGLHLTQIPR